MYSHLFSKPFPKGVALLGASLLIVFAATCNRDLSNPLDPDSDSYIGDQSAYDHDAPEITYAGSYDSITTSVTSLVLAGNVSDINGIDSLLVNGEPVTVTDTSWTYTYSLQTGVNTIVVRAVDNSYHANEFVDTILVTRIGAPNAPSLSPLELSGADIKVTWQDNSSDETGFVVLRSVDNATYTPIDTVNADVTEYIDSYNFQPGTQYIYQIVAINDLGASTASTPLGYTYPVASISDTTGPVVAFLSPSNGDTIGSTPTTVAVSVNDESGVETVTVNDSIAQDKGAYWEAQVPLSAGDNLLIVTTTDKAPNANITVDSVVVYYDANSPDLAAPVVTFVSPTQGDTVNQASVTVVINAFDQSEVAWIKLGDSLMTFLHGNYSATASLAQGNNNIIVQASDQNGNSAFDTISVYYDPSAQDNTAPVVTIHVPQNNSKTGYDSVVVAGTATDNSEVDYVLVNGDSAVFTAPNWQKRLGLQHGLNTVVVSAVDISTSANQTNDTIAVIYNQAPVFAPKADTTIDVGIYGTVVSATDLDSSDFLSFTALSVPAGVTVTANSDTAAIVDGYQPASARVDTFKILVQDNWEDSDTLVWAVTVTSPGTNREPYFVTDTADIPKTATAGQAYAVDINAEDPDSDPVIYGLAGQPTGMTISPTTGQINWTPTASDTGQHRIVVQAQDGQYLIQMSWWLTVSAANRAPVLSSPGDTTIEEGEQLQLTLAATDPDGDVISLAMPEFPAGATLQDSSFAWTPTFDQSGTHTVTFVATDDGTPTLSDSATITITVTDAVGPPSFTTLPTDMGDTASASIAYIDTVQATDPEGGAITYTVLAGPSGLSVDAATGEVTFTPAMADTGLDTVSIIATATTSTLTDTLTWELYVASWKLVGSRGFSAGAADYVSLQVYNGTPYVAYSDGGNSDAATVMAFDGSNWTPVGGSAGISAGATAYTSLCVAGGVPYLAYQDANQTNAATVMKYETSSWQIVGSAGFSASSVEYVSMDIYNDTVYVAYQDYARRNFVRRKATVQRFNGSSWDNVGSPGFSSNRVNYVSLAIDAGIPYVGFMDAGDGSGATVMSYNGIGGWGLVGTSNLSQGVAGYVSLGTDNGSVYVAYRDANQSNGATVREYSSSWDVVGTAGFSDGQADYTSLFVYAGVPYLAYRDGAHGNRVTVMRFAGAAWESVGQIAFSSGAGDYVSLYVENSVPYVAFKDAGISGQATVMKYE